MSEYGSTVRGRSLPGPGREAYALTMNEIFHDVDGSRFEVARDGEVVGVLGYADADGVRDLLHTVVAPEFERQGLAGALVRAAVDDARAQGLSIRPTCTYVQHWLDRNPAEKDLLQPRVRD